MSKIFVGGLNVIKDDSRHYVKGPDLEELFGKYGEVTKADRVRGKNFGFVNMKRREDALKAVEKLNRSDIKTQKLAVELAKSMPVKLFVAQIPKSTKGTELEQLFEKQGASVLECDLLNQKGYGFVTIETNSDKNIPERLISDLNGFNFNGGRLAVKYGKTKEQNNEQLDYGGEGGPVRGRMQPNHRDRAAPYPLQPSMNNMNQGMDNSWSDAPPLPLMGPDSYMAGEGNNYAREGNNYAGMDDRDLRSTLRQQALSGGWGPSLAGEMGIMEGGGRGRRPVLLGDDPEMGHMMQGNNLDRGGPMMDNYAGNGGRGSYARDGERGNDLGGGYGGLMDERHMSEVGGRHTTSIDRLGSGDRHRHDEVPSKKSRWGSDSNNYDKRGGSSKKEETKDKRPIVTIDIDDPAPVPAPLPPPVPLASQPETNQKEDIAKDIADLENDNAKHILSSLGTQLTELVKCSKFIDTHIQCNGATFKCHGVILAAKSKVFRDTLSKSDTIMLPKLNARVVNSLLKYMYSGTVDLNDLDSAERVDLVKAADNYDIEGAKNAIIVALAKGLNSSTLVSTLQLADTSKLTVLRSIVTKYIVVNRRTVLDNPAIKSAIKKFPDVMFEIVESL